MDEGTRGEAPIDRRALDELNDRFRTDPDADLALRILDMRTDLGAEAVRRGRNGAYGGFPPSVPGPRGGRLMEIAATDLDGEAVRQGVLGTGALVVRGLYDQDTVAMLAEAARTRDAGEDGPDHGAKVIRLGADKGLESVVLTDGYGRTRLPAALREYFAGAPVLCSARRAKLRRTQKIAPLPWHQDMAFFGRRHFAINCWAAITPCGTEAPSLKFVPRPFGEVVGWNLADGPAPIGYANKLPGELLAPILAETPPVTLIMEPGDAVLFDETTLHASAVAAKNFEEQIVTISWFFHPAMYPARPDALLI